MATFKAVHGANIPIRASDPANPQVGEVWYNTTTHALKARINVVTAIPIATPPIFRKEKNLFFNIFLHPILIFLFTIRIRFNDFVVI